MSSFLFFILPLLFLLYASYAWNDILEREILDIREYGLVLVGASLLYSIVFFLSTKRLVFSLDSLTRVHALMFSILAFVSVVGGYEDLKCKEVNRNLLRISYGVVTLLGLFFVRYLTDSPSSLYMYLISFFVAFMIVLLFFNGIGPSDARMFLLISPIVVFLFKQLSLLAILVSLVICMAYQKYRQKELGALESVPLAPAILWPILAIVFIYFIFPGVLRF